MIALETALEYEKHVPLIGHFTISGLKRRDPVDTTLVGGSDAAKTYGLKRDVTIACRIDFPSVPGLIYPLSSFITFCTRTSVAHPHFLRQPIAGLSYPEIPNVMMQSDYGHLEWVFVGDIKIVNPLRTPHDATEAASGRFFVRAGFAVFDNPTTFIAGRTRPVAGQSIHSRYQPCFFCRRRRSILFKQYFCWSSVCS